MTRWNRKRRKAHGKRAAWRSRELIRLPDGYFWIRIGQCPCEGSIYLEAGTTLFVDGVMWRLRKADPRREGDG